jgi:hypothetical protein
VGEWVNHTTVCMAGNVRRRTPTKSAAYTHEHLVGWNPSLHQDVCALPVAVCSDNDAYSQPQAAKQTRPNGVPGPKYLAQKPKENAPRAVMGPSRVSRVRCPIILSCSCCSHATVRLGAMECVLITIKVRRYACFHRPSDYGSTSSYNFRILSTPSLPFPLTPTPTVADTH